MVIGENSLQLRCICPENQVATFYGPLCIYVELTWLQPHVHCVFAVVSQMEEVQLTASYAQVQHGRGISRVELR